MQIGRDRVFFKDGKNISRYDVIDAIQFPMGNMPHHIKTFLSLKKKKTISKNESSPIIDNNNKSTSGRFVYILQLVCYEAMWLFSFFSQIRGLRKSLKRVPIWISV